MSCPGFHRAQKIFASAVTAAHVHAILRSKNVLENVPKRYAVYADGGDDTAEL